MVAGFFDAGRLADAAVRVMRNPAAVRPLWAAARYELAGCLGRLAAFFEEVADR